MVLESCLKDLVDKFMDILIVDFEIIGGEDVFEVYVVCCFKVVILVILFKGFVFRVVSVMWVGVYDFLIKLFLFDVFVVKISF